MTGEQQRLTWIGLHVYRYSGQDLFLLECLDPVLAALRRDGVVHRTFFLRYWQGGHHLRIRLQVAPSSAEPVAARAGAAFAEYLAEHPGDAAMEPEEFLRDAQPTLAALENQVPEAVHPPDSIRRVAYSPEYDKYGGERGVQIAEQFFDRSSGVVLRGLPRPTWRAGDPAPPQDSARRLGSAFSMMVRALVACGYSAAEMARFFGHYCLLWSPYVFADFMDTWPRLVAAAEGTVGGHVRELLGDPARDDPYATAVRAAYRQLRAESATVLSSVTMLGRAASEEERLRAVLSSYLHTHNNRWGLAPGQEAFLGYLGHHVLSARAGIPAQKELLTAADRRRAAAAGRRPSISVL